MNYLTFWFRNGILIFLSIVGVNCVLPSYLHVCQKTDPEIANCVNNSISTLLPHLKVGIPDLDVPALEPLTLDVIELRTGNNATNIGARLSNLKIWGPSSFIIQELKVNVAKNIFRFKVIIPKLHVEGDYKADAKVLFFNVKGDGKFDANLTDYWFECKMKGHVVKRDGDDYLEFEKMKLKIEIGKGIIHLDNLFNGDPVLGRATSDAISDNSDVFLNEIKPVLQNGLSETFTNIANKITNKFTYKELLP